MGRPPIGKRAMTGAERVRRHREKQPKPPTKRALLADNERLKVEVERLTAENERLRARAKRRS